MFSERRGRRSLHPNIQQVDKPEFKERKLQIDCFLSFCYNAKLKDYVPIRRNFL